MSKPESEGLIFEGLEVNVYRGGDGTIVVDLLGPGDEDTTEKGEPDIRVWMNEALIYAHGRVGDDLSNGGEIVAVEVKNHEHREIDCPLCEGPVCDLDGDSDKHPSTRVNEILAILERSESLCMDDDQDRKQLAAILDEEMS